MDGLKPVLVREKDQRSGKIVHEECFALQDLRQCSQIHEHRGGGRTVIAVVGVDAVAVVETLDSARYIDVEVVVARVLLVLDAREVLEQILVYVEREGPRRQLLVVDGSVKRECLVNDINNLYTDSQGEYVGNIDLRQTLSYGRDRLLRGRSTHIGLDGRIHRGRPVACAHIGGRHPRHVANRGTRVCRAGLKTMTVDEVRACELE